MSPASHYRPALDGLRAVAVIPVIAYHLGWVRGGFLGVDVFFVLSGYLITTLLLREFSQTGRISVTSFWARRARRLFPAVLLLVAVCLLELTKVRSESASLAARREDIISTLFYFANWHFIAADQSYFGTFAGVSPLRHMWSLAIEEQFYLVWPIVMLISMRLVKSGFLLLMVVVGVLASAVDLTYQFEAHNPSRAYFGTDSRAQVLLVGVALALLIHRRPGILSHPRARRAAGIAAVPAAAAVVAGYALMKDQAPFYYWGGLLLFSGVVAVLIWTLETLPRSPVGRLISIGPMNWVGRISYSLYLWHWPVIIWTSSFVAVDPRVQKGLALTAMTVMATLSFYVVERPIRLGRTPWLRLSKIRLAVAVPISLALFAGVTVQVTKAQNDEVSDRPCPPGSPMVDQLTYCVKVNPTIDNAPVVVTAGDSTSRALTPGLTPIAVKNAWRLIQAGQNGCSFLPLDIVRRARVGEQRTCAKDVPQVLRRISSRYDSIVWIISDVFVLAGFIRDADGVILQPNDSRRVPIIRAALRRTLKQLTTGGSKVVLVPVPPRGEPPYCGTRTTGPTCSDPQYSVADPASQQLARLYQQVAREMPDKVTIVSVTDVLCNDHGHCPAIVGGLLARYDGVHYTTRFSIRLAPKIVARAERAGVSFERASRP